MKAVNIRPIDKLLFEAQRIMQKYRAAMGQADHCLQKLQPLMQYANPD